MQENTGLLIKQQQQRFVGLSSVEEMDFIRYYDFENDRIRFHIVTVDKSTTPATTTEQNTWLNPISTQTVHDALTAAGFSAIELYADLDKSPWQSTSKNTVYVAQK